MFTVDMINMTVKLKNNLEFYIIVSNLKLYMYISSTQKTMSHTHTYLTKVK